MNSTHLNKTKLDCFAPLRIAAMVYITLPLLVFCIGFLRWYYALLCTAVICVILYRVLKEDTYFSRIKNSWKTVCIVFLFTMLWSYLGGMNGFYYQSFDWYCRNAVYFDLIQYDWPVMYNTNGSALVYYIGHWLPPAFLAKCFVKITGSVDVGLFCGRMLLWIWSSVGLTLVILLLFQVLRVENKKQRIIATALFVFFSGMDLLGAVLINTLDRLMRVTSLHGLTPHLESWMNGFQFSSNMTLLFWVFNQTIVPWIITLCFLLDDHPRHYVFYCVCCLICGPFPCVGLAVLMIVKAGVFCFKVGREKKWVEIGRGIFSLQNILAFLALFPFVASYILSSNAVSGSTAAGITQTVPLFSTRYMNDQLYVFILIEVGFYLILVAVDHYREPLYYACWLTFILFPCFHIGTSIDFCMRSTIPALLIVMVYVNRFLIEHLNFGRKTVLLTRKQTIQKRCATILLVCYIIGMGTPIVELYRGAYHVIHEKTIFLEDRRLMTLNRKRGSYNFVAEHPQEHFFFRYFAKTNTVKDGAT